MAKSHLEIFNIFFIFQNKSSTRGVGCGGMNLALWEMSQTAIKLCFSEPRGLFYILWHEDTEREPFSWSLAGLLAHQPGSPQLPPFPSWGLSPSQKR